MMLALVLADALLTAMMSLFFLTLGQLTLHRVRVSKYAPEKLAGARTGALVAFAASGLFLALAVRELITG